jgi:HD-like signal output (HDOD) protein
VAEAVSADPEIASTVLRLANSAAFAQAERVSSVAKAITAIGCAKLRGIVLASADEIFLMGLLHRLGQFFFLSNDKTRATFPLVLRRMGETGCDYVTAELEEIGFSHPLLGALVANRWNFPLDVSQTILHYADPLEGIDSPASRKLALVKLADLLAEAAGIGHPEDCSIDQGTLQQIARWLGLIEPDSDDVEILIEEAREQFKAEAQLWL